MRETRKSGVARSERQKNYRQFAAHGYVEVERDDAR